MFEWCDTTYVDSSDELPWLPRFDRVLEWSLSMSCRLCRVDKHPESFSQQHESHVSCELRWERLPVCCVFVSVYGTEIRETQIHKTYSSKLSLSLDDKGLDLCQTSHLQLTSPYGNELTLWPDEILVPVLVFEFFVTIKFVFECWCSSDFLKWVWYEWYS